MRIIDADAFLKRLQRDPLYDLIESYGISYVINAEPTVDAVPVIRCKDCKYWSTDDGMFKDIDERQWHHCPHIGIDTDEYFFCSEAERKE